MTKVISFCLFGNNPKYTVGAIRNAELALKWYPGWECWFYMAASEAVEGRTTHYYSEIAQKLLDVGPHVQIKVVDQVPDWKLMLSRFLAITETNVEVAIFRDTDSRLSEREAIAVNEWLASAKTAIIFRDHPWHTTEILGGGWGMKQDCLLNFKQILESWPSENKYQTDQEFLRQIIWLRIKDQSLIFDEFYPHIWGGKPFPICRNGLDFFGKVFNENEETVIEHEDVLGKWLLGHKKKN